MEFEERDLDQQSLEERAAALNQAIADLERRLDEIGNIDSEFLGSPAGDPSSSSKTGTV